MLWKTTCVVFAILVSSQLQNVKPESKQKIQWISIEDAAVKAKSYPKPIIIDLYANWCYWCKVMDKKTYNNSKVVEYINDHFYPVKLDAESKETVQWRDQQFDFNKQVNLNDFTLYVTNGDLSFPTTVIYPSPSEAPATVPGFMSPDEIEPILKYFGEGNYKKQTFQEFLKTFKRTW